ncbi:MAG: hypothetical protein R3B51_13655 [Thermodesulfobacteriota bacterium]
MYDPVKDEMFTAELGKGAFLNGDPIHVTKTGQWTKATWLRVFVTRIRRYSDNLRNFANFMSVGARA